MPFARFVIAAALVAAACDDPNTGAGLRPELTVLTDLDPDPAAVEVELIAELARVELLPGKPAEVWAFRDGAVAGSAATIPGPMLEANLGDRVIVHFHNRLPEATTIHWHGLRVPNGADGTPASQQLVAPGGRFDYEFVIADPGLFWYHPHVDAERQVERGLYAPIRVRGGVDPEVAADRVFVLDDVKLEASGALSTTTNQLDVMLGRQGNVLLVNGKVQPDLAVAAGTRERWRFVNAANGRYFHLDLPGRRLRVIGWDGGPLVAPYEVDSLVVAPGERYDVLVEIAGAPGEVLPLRTTHYDRGHDLPDPGPQTLMTVTVGEPGVMPAPLPDRWADVTPIPIDAATPRRRFVLRETVGTTETTFSINDQRFPDITPVVVGTDQIEIWEVENATEMDHPFHLHGMSFQVLDDALAVPRLGWKDTVNVPRATTARLAVRFGPPGRWMFHCHILEHAERGMMGELEVTPSP